MRLKNYSKGRGFVFIENANVNESVLNNSKLHFFGKTEQIFLLKTY